MRDPDTCPICLLEYTSDEVHKPSCLKCGHIFGHKCLIRWFREGRRSFCPTCAKPCKKADIRVIYDVSFRTTDSKKEKELIENFLNEHKKNEDLILENANLRETIQHLNSEIHKLEMIIHSLKVKNEYSQSLACKNVYSRFHFSKRLRSINRNSKVAFDRANNAIFITSRDSKTIGYKKVGYQCDSFEYFPLFDRKCCSFFATDIQISPHNDGLLLIAYSNIAKLLNPATGNILIDINIENNIRTMCFDHLNRNIIYFGDERGYLVIYDLRKLNSTQKLFIDKGIHSIAKIDCYLFAGCAKTWYKINTKIQPLIPELMDIEKNLKCVNLMSGNDKLLVTFRDNGYKTLHFVYTSHNDGIDKNCESFVDDKIIDDSNSSEIGGIKRFIKHKSKSIHKSNVKNYQHINSSLNNNETNNEENKMKKESINHENIMNNETYDINKTSRDVVITEKNDNIAEISNQQNLRNSLESQTAINTTYFSKKTGNSYNFSVITNKKIDNLSDENTLTYVSKKLNIDNENKKNLFQKTTENQDENKNATPKKSTIPIQEKNTDLHTHLENYILLSRCYQFGRKNDKIVGNYIYICNEQGNKIEVYSLDGFRNIDNYKFRDRIVDFVVDNKRMYVVSENYINVLET
ncbi:hypothetical protein EDEG_03136 [Edhazardia aedis USNM 41457]|uniref:RING-type domain-containing protein n=1 Tax=Edhazardia aedis (strain USNM 41457) TaxID=1003232 RepID=J8ZRY5_EDHAE|nr:hypothetical protein EDEG_03136 [Edhazardia aedis USNM 41457]|eukprot:EJW02463.1 hypothetical protein EDEG_03136 [Edhazardia aedis USNM 41457]